MSHRARHNLWLDRQSAWLPPWSANDRLDHERIAAGIPAQRVINSKGELSGSWAFGQSGTMRQLLEAEGIVFSADERVDMKRYGWDPTRDLSEEALQHILDAAAHTPVNASERLLYLMRTDLASPLRGREDS